MRHCAKARGAAAAVARAALPAVMNARRVECMWVSSVGFVSIEPPVVPLQPGRALDLRSPQAKTARDLELCPDPIHALGSAQSRQSTERTRPDAGRSAP